MVFRELESDFEVHFFKFRGVKEGGLRDADGIGKKWWVKKKNSYRITLLNLQVTRTL